MDPREAFQTLSTPHGLPDGLSNPSQPFQTLAAHQKGLLTHLALWEALPTPTVPPKGPLETSRPTERDS